LEAILALQGCSSEAPQWSEAIWRDLQQSGAMTAPARGVFVAESRGQVAGFVVARSVDGLAELESIVVDQAERRRGIGRALCERVIAWAREQAALMVELEVRAGNDRARSFYRSLGFEEQGTRRNYYRAPVEDAVVMTLPLHA
jgi:ribosomal-protein-alanine N-acetyltransferase